MNLKLGVLFILKVSTTLHCQGAHLAKNVQEFNALCRLFQMAYNNRDKQPEGLIGEKWNRIETLASEREQVANATAKSPVELDVPLVGKIRLKSERAVHQAHVMALVVARQVGSLKVESEEQKEKAIQAAKTVVECLRKALAGKTKAGITEIDTQPPGLITSGGSDNVRRSVACVAKTGGDGQHAGSSLSNDLICLCAPGNTGQTYHKEVCGFVGSTGSSNFWYNTQQGSSVPGQLTSDWVQISTACRNDQQLRENLTPENLGTAIQQFNQLLGAQASAAGTLANGKTARWVLGVPKANAVTCIGDDASAATNICVNYGHATDGTFVGIDWRDELETAKTELLTIRENQNEAERIYAKALRIIERQNTELISLNISENMETGGADLVTSTKNKNENQNPSTPTDKATAQEPGGLNDAKARHFMLPWIFFI